MTNTTLLQILVLNSIRKKQTYPYQIFKRIQNKGIEIKLHSIYPCLKVLEKKGYVKTITKVHGKLYKITDKGIELLERIEYINSLFLAKK